MGTTLRQKIKQLSLVQQQKIERKSAELLVEESVRQNSKAFQAFLKSEQERSEVYRRLAES
ncbi:MAG: hypothetical protein PUP93_16235 [Rhizonema sp. NSF051]|nr:hypothetical protein [Rhizonema sp. NSF051]